VLEGHTDKCNSVAFSPDGRQLVSGSNDGAIRLWNVQTGAVLQVIAGHSVSVSAIAYSPGGGLIVSGSFDVSVRVWDMATGLQVSVYTGHSQVVTDVAFSADGQRIASTGWHGKVHVWSAGAAHGSDKVLDRSALLLAFLSPHRLLVASLNGSVGVWDLESDSWIEQHDHHLGKISGFAVTPDKKLAASLSRNRDTIAVWDAQTWIKTATPM